MTAIGSIGAAVRVFLRDLASGFFEIVHNGFALVGLAVVFSAITLTARPELRQAGETRLLGWLYARTAQTTGLDADLAAVDRTTATNPQDLPKAQAALAHWLSRKYRVAPEPLGALVAEAFELGEKTKLDPTLILAVAAIESGFNPFAQSPVGAQGLMQVMTVVHSEKYEYFGGRLAAFDPVTNLRVGTRVLQDCIARAGSLNTGLKLYVGAGPSGEDGGYVDRVLAEQTRLRQVAAGRAVPFAPASNPTARVPEPAAGSKTEPEPERVAQL